MTHSTPGTVETGARVHLPDTRILSFSLSLSLYPAPFGTIRSPFSSVFLPLLSFAFQLPPSLLARALRFFDIFHPSPALWLLFSAWYSPLSFSLSLFALPFVPPSITRVRLARSRYRSPRRVRESRDRATFLSQSLAQSGFVATYRCTRDR